MLLILTLSTLLSMSPFIIPASSAGEPGSILDIITKLPLSPSN